MSNGQVLLAVDIGGTHVRIGAANRDGAIAEREKLSSDKLRVAEPVAALASLIEDYIAPLPVKPSKIVVGVPGFMNETRRIVIKAPNIKHLSNVALADGLEKSFGVPVLLEHDVTLRVRGEWVQGAAAGAATMLGIYFGTGIGASFLKDGMPMRGGPYGMELGHIHIRDEGAICGCGGVDCAEAHASGRVLANIAQRFALPLDNIFSERDKNPELDKALTRFLEDQAMTVAVATVLLDPTVIVLGGGVMEMKDYPHAELHQLTLERLPPVHEEGRHRFVNANLGWSSVLYGALAVADERT